MEEMRGHGRLVAVPLGTQTKFSQVSPRLLSQVFLFKPEFWVYSNLWDD